MSELKEALGKGSDLEFAGRTWHIRPLTFNDLCDLEERFGDVASIDLSRATSQRFVLWMILRKGAKDEFGATLTENEVGEMLTLDEPQRISEFIQQVFSISGLVGSGSGSGENDAKNAGKPAAKPRKAVGAS